MSHYEELLAIPTCSEKHAKLIKSTEILVGIYCARYDYSATDTFTCGWCANTDEWTIPEMLWSVEDEYFVTPCCHTEAITALYPDEPRSQYDQNREDNELYVWAVMGR